MNDILKVIGSHVSIRRYTAEPVDDADLNRILEAACSGSTMGNMQLFSIIVTTDKSMMRRMAPAHFNQPMATEAPLILTFCADLHRFNRFCGFRGAETGAYSNLQAYHWAFTDAVIAAQNACTAAESLGLGLCWLGTVTFNADQFVDILRLPENVVPVACIAIGHPAEHPEHTLKLPAEAVVHHETYREYEKDDIDRLYFEQEHSAQTQALLEENHKDNLAQVFTQCRYTKKDNEHFSQVLAKVLKNQKFLQIGTDS